MKTFYSFICKELSFSTAFILIIHFIFLVYLHIIGHQILSFDFFIILNVLFSFFSLYFISSSIGLIRMRYINFFVNYIFIIIVFAYLWYIKKVAEPFDMDLFSTNKDLLLYSESWVVIKNKMGETFFHISGVLLLLFIFLEYKFKSFSKKTIHFFPKGILYIVFYLALIWGQTKGYDPTISLVRSFFGVGRHEIFDHPILATIDSKSGYFKKNFAFKKPRFNKRPNVIMLFIESLNGNLVQQLARNSKKQILPNFNQLSQKSLFYPNFLGNSIQTERGLIASFCGIIPSVKKSIFYEFPNNNFRCVPEVLKEQGYNTIFFQAYRDLSFGNKKTFLSKIGFETVDTVHKHLQKGDKEKYWGWGLQDDIYYKRFFGYLKKSSENDKRPFFVSLLTVSSHMAFRHLPESEKKIYKYKGRNSYKNYINAINAADRYLKTFLEEFFLSDISENTVLLIMGDHGYPVGEHGVFNNHVSGYNGNFKTPLIVYWKDVIKPVLKEDYFYSQLDIPLTIMDLLGISGSSHYSGKSLFQKDHSKKNVFLVQPYNGIFISAVNNNFKYIKNLKKSYEMLFDLKNDPFEENNLIDNNKYAHKLKSLRNTSGEILLNYKLLEENKHW